MNPDEPIRRQLFFKVADAQVRPWMELLSPTTAKVVAYYEHPEWGRYVAVTQNTYRKGVATYIGCMTDSTVTEKIVVVALKKASLWGQVQTLYFPFITKQGTNEQGKLVHYLLNYSAKPGKVSYPFPNGRELLQGVTLTKNSELELAPWGVKIIEEP